MNISFENKIALVTGAASELGLATAKAFAESDASVVLADWNEKAVRSAAEELTAQGHKHSLFFPRLHPACVDKAVATCLRL